MIARDAGWKLNPGLEVHDKDGRHVGFIDQASDAQGWMQVETLGPGLQRLWIPYRLIESADDREVIVTLTKASRSLPVRSTLTRSGACLRTNSGCGPPTVRKLAGSGSSTPRWGTR